jgi:hypothetical protein
MIVHGLGDEWRPPRFALDAVHPTVSIEGSVLSVLA